MEQAWRYRGRTITGGDVVFIRELIAAHPAASRCELSRRLCEAWDWKQPNGAPRDMVCRGMLLMLDRGGEIVLPPMRSLPSNPFLLRARPEPVVPDNRPVRGALHDLLPLTIEQVRRGDEEPLFNSLMEQYHYLGYEQPVGEHLKYLVKAQGQVIACAAWSSAPRHLGARDRFIGWDQAARRRNIHLIAYNTRFLILPWVRVPQLASHILGRMARQTPRDWLRMGDLYMSLIHTCELCGGNPFDYLTALQKHATEIEQNPAAWMPWNYGAALKQAALAKVA